MKRYLKMARLAPQVKLSEAQRTILEELSRSRQVPHSLVQRAEIVLGAAAGKSNTEMSGELGLVEESIGRWRRRWVEGAKALGHWEGKAKRLREAIEKLLGDEARRGCPPTFSAEQVCQIIALACERPPVPLTHWTQEDLAREVVKRGIAEEISARSVGRFLKSGAAQTAPDKLLAQSRGGRRSVIPRGSERGVQTLPPS
jgi:putative transposase